MALLADSGRPVVAIGQLMEGSFPDGAVVLTFDDGCASDLSVALPVLRSHRFPAAFFVNPATIGRNGFLTWRELEALTAAGMHVGSHGLDHRLFDDMTTVELEHQLVESKVRIEERLGIPVTTLALPGGSGVRRAPELARRIGYRSVLGSVPALASKPHLARLLPRFAVRRPDSIERVRGLVRGERIPLLRARARYSLLRRIKALTGRRIFDRARRMVREMRASA
jgi:peptidoglycan/xylan/chitin deacetylase (PgdA/CDA1 family)